MSRRVEDCIAAAAAAQHGVVTHRQLVAAGLSPDAIGRRLRAGRLRALHRGIYLVGPLQLPHTREMAAVLASGTGAVLSHLSAAGVWGLREGTGGPVEVTTLANRGHRPGIRAHRPHRLDDDERTVRDGIPITTPERTLFDLAAVLDSQELESSAAHAEREALITRETLTRMLARHRRAAGTPALRAMLERDGGPVLTRSAAETEFLALVRGAGLPPPECNVIVGRYEVDFLWRQSGIVVEVDGFQYHSSRPRFERDRRKDAELVAAGLTVLRLSWRQITQEGLATAVRLGQALARASP